MKYLTFSSSEDFIPVYSSYHGLIYISNMSNIISYEKVFNKDLNKHGYNIYTEEMKHSVFINCDDVHFECNECGCVWDPIWVYCKQCIDKI